MSPHHDIRLHSAHPQGGAKPKRAGCCFNQVFITNWLCKTIFIACWQQEAQALIMSSCMSYCGDGIHATSAPQHSLASVLCPEGTAGCPGGIFEVHDSATLADSEGKGHAIRLFTRNHRRDGEEREGGRETAKRRLIGYMAF